MYNQAPEAGLATLLASRGRNGDSMLVHMAPEEVAGLRQIALAHGGDLYKNPRTGLYEASFLKKILPQIIGAVLPSVPGLGNFAKTLGMGNQALGSALLVGGASALIEGDLKKGLMAGLGAYSGASIGAGLKAAAGVEPTSQVTTAPTTLAGQLGLKESDLIAPSGFDSKSLLGVDTAYTPGPIPAVSPIRAADIVQTVTPRQAPTSFLGTMGRGVKNIFTTPEGGARFMEGLGGGYKSPIGQALSRYATFTGAMLPFAEEPQAFPTGGMGGDEIVYIPAKYDPSKSTVFQSPGQYFRRTAQGLVPYNPFAPAPKPRGFATGGPVQPADQNMNQPRSIPHQGVGIPYPNQNFPLANVTGTPYSNMQTGSTPQSREIIGNYEPDVDPYTGEQRFAEGGAVAGDPNVAAVRAYIEELNRRAREGLGVLGAPGVATGGVGAFGPQYLPPPSPAGNIMDGGGAAAGPSTADIVGGIAGSYLTNKAVDAGIGYLRDKFFPSADQLKDIETTGKRVGEASSTAGPSVLDADLANLSAFNPNLSSLSGMLPRTAGLESLGTLGGLESTGYQLGQFTDPVQVAQGYSVPELSSMMEPSGSIASQTGGMRAALEAGAGTPATPVLDADLAALTKVGGDLSRLSSLMPVKAGLESLGTLGGLSSTGLGALAPTALADAAKMTSLSGAYGTSGSIASQAGGMRGALEASKAAGAAPAQAGLGSFVTGKVIPGAQTALGLYEAYKGIKAGNEAQAALGGLSAGLGAGALAGYSGLAALGPIGLGAAAIAALGSALFGGKSDLGEKQMKSYWNNFQSGNPIGSFNPNELSVGFVDFFRSPGNQFPALSKYGEQGQENFLYDMTQVINNAVKEGVVDKNVDPATMYKQVVQPWLNSMGSGPQKAEVRGMQDYIMTDLINSFMRGQNISNAQVKNDKNYKIVSDRPVYAGVAPDLNRTIGGQAVPEDVARELYQDFNVRQKDLDSWMMSNPVARMQALGQMPAATSPFAEPVEDVVRAQPMPESVPVSPFAAPLTEEMKNQPFINEPVAPPSRAPAPYVPPDALTDLSIPGNISPVQEFVGTPYMPEVVAEEPIYTPREEAVPITLEPVNPFAEREAEMARQAEQARMAQEAEMARQAEMQRQAEQARMAQEAEMARQAEAARAAREAQMAREADEFRKIREFQAMRDAELARQAEMQRVATEQEAARRAEETRRAREVQLAQEAEMARRAEEEAQTRRQLEAARREQERIAEEQLRLEEQRRIEAERVYVPRQESVPVYQEPIYQEPDYSGYLSYNYNPFEGYAYNPFEGFSMNQFAGGGAVGEDFNFGFAHGGMPGEYRAGGRLLNGPGDGMSDDIPAVIRGQGVQRAALADGEFVIPADVVSHLGNGSTNAGAKKLYEMMAKIRQARTGDKKQAPAVKADRYMPV